VDRWWTTPFGDHQLFSVDEQILSMNAEAALRRCVAVIDVPFAAIADA